MNSKRTALLLNALVVPGLGQLYLGRKVTGTAIIMLVNLLLLLALFVLMKGLAPVIAARAISGSTSAQEVYAALHGVAGFGKALLAGFALLWAASIIDVARFHNDGAPPQADKRKPE
jgi:TM2 domain-containing membrane protein YozV